MKLLFAIVQNDDHKALTYALIERNISVTRIASTGGFLRGGNSTLMIGVETDRFRRRSKSSGAFEPQAGRYCSRNGIPHNIDSVAMPMTVTVGGATVFVLDVQETYKY
jgi:uncharacterized protein YaaQ